MFVVEYFTSILSSLALSLGSIDERAAVATAVALAIESLLSIFSPSVSITSPVDLAAITTDSESSNLNLCVASVLAASSRYHRVIASVGLSFKNAYSLLVWVRCY
ncbi:MAG: hypothetical protein RMI56_02010 [Sulfolobales archaeon]|nr:hypothetical protein [Sulfolobales archaeon]MDW8082551.1 hypothetical protein [Sulfolobales archaeon]